MRRYVFTLVASVITASLTGCGGSDSSPSGNTSILSGKVIDGYISGATVFLDVNFNGELDENEPSAVTDENGEFDLLLNETLTECSLYVPTVTHVPVGAIDSDSPDTPITEAYTMISPPPFAMGTDEELLNLTPLSSIVWESVEKELARDGEQLSCQSVIADLALREKITDRLEQQEFRTAQRYNITIDELYGDYIESGNTELHELAQALVPGLQASYAETLVLEENNPEADYVFVEYFIGLSDNFQRYDDSWYRREFVQASTGNWASRTNQVSDDLSEILAVVEQYSQRTKLSDSVEYAEDFYLTRSNEWTLEVPSYYCGVSETYTQIADLAYGVANSANSPVYESSWESCLAFERLGNTTQSLITKVFSDNGNTLLTESYHSFDSENPSGMEHLIGLGDDIDDLDGSELNQLNYIDTAFENTDAYGAAGWRRVKNVYTSSDLEQTQQTQTVHVHTNTDDYTVYVYNPDGTSTMQCGLWSTQELEDCTPDK
ncbi:MULTISPECIES: hypothetical protein [unclassified Agarivorans]|uniref:hypothetical protein n=1 Tax=unclassified Agarivorans TaxID=2636026 RepID=UPI0026E1166C|nr:MULTISPECIES: hypothetical protein [unclassified Agarivorans]MDO6687078.1 hypothetical protein [Agarivorans sp. 3_MG-2023]MDO6713510.1 hypothetical protein [Agarivorans sp. 2_MG-2023]